MERRLTIEEAARKSARSPRELRLLIESGELAAIRGAGRWLIDPLELERLGGSGSPPASAQLEPASAGPLLARLEGLAGEVTALHGAHAEPPGRELSDLRARLDAAEARIARLERTAPRPEPAPPPSGRKAAMRDALHPLFGRTDPAEDSP